MFRFLPLLYFSISALLAQVTPPVITHIVIEGNVVTQDHIILRELTHPIHQAFDSTLAREDRVRLYNLNIFETVTIYPLTTPQGLTVLVIEVVESFRIFPIPLIYHLEGLGWSYGGGVTFSNFRGLNEQLTVSKTFGGENTYIFALSDPWVIRNRIGVSGQVVQTSRGHRVYPLRDQLRLAALGARKVSKDKTMAISTEISWEQHTTKWSDGDTPLTGVDPRNVQHKTFKSRFTIVWRTTDIWRDPTKGGRIGLSITPVVGLTQQSPTYTQVRVNGSWFRVLRRSQRPTVLAVGVALLHYNRESPVYLKQYLGSGWVRGHASSPSRSSLPLQDYLDSYETTNVANASLELRQTLIPRQLWDQTELGLAGVVFVDAGWGYSPDRPLFEARPIVGYGAGLRIYVPVIEVLGFDLGTNSKDGRLRLQMRFTHKF